MSNYKQTQLAEYTEVTPTSQPISTIATTTTITTTSTTSSVTSTPAQKQTNDALSPVDTGKLFKKANTTQKSSEKMETIQMETSDKDADAELDETGGTLKAFLLEEFNILKGTITNKCLEIKEELKEIITRQATEGKESICEMGNKVHQNTDSIAAIMDENKRLWHENKSLKDRIGKLEKAQLSNNVIITGMQEAPWEKYEVTKERVAEAISGTMGKLGDTEILQQVRKVEISNCGRVGAFCMNRSRPILVTFQQKDDKECLLANKRYLPLGIYK